MRRPVNMYEVCVRALFPQRMHALSLGSVRGRLVLSNRGLVAVPAEGIPPSVEGLDLSSNALVGTLTLPPMPHLMELRLGDNALEAVDVQRASPLPPSLRVLDLGANRLTVLPPCVLRLRALSVLRVDRQQLRSLPAELSLLAELSELDAGFNELSEALTLVGAGLPRLRRLVLRSNALGRGRVVLDPGRLPSLTELDLAGNGLCEWPVDVGGLTMLRSLCLANNKLTTLVSSQTVAHRRMWVPSAGVHTLTQLAELVLAQNALVDLPTALVELRALCRLDVRCNPLSNASLRLAAKHCGQCSARLDVTSLRRAADGVLLGDESSAWHKPTLLRARVGRVLSVGVGMPPDGVPLSRLKTRLPAEVALLGLDAAAASEDVHADPSTAASASPAAGGEPRVPCDAAGHVVTVEELRKAFRSRALRMHPDKVAAGSAAEARDGAASRFAALQDAYRLVGRAVASERRRLPRFDELLYAYVDMPASSPPLADSDRSPTANDDDAQSLAFRSQLEDAMAFATEARAADDGALLVHAAGRDGGVHSLALVLAILIERGEPNLRCASRALAETLELPSGSELQLPAGIAAELEHFATERRASRMCVEHEFNAQVGATLPRAMAGEPAAARTAAATSQPAGGVRLNAHEASSTGSRLGPRGLLSAADGARIPASSSRRWPPGQQRSVPPPRYSPQLTVTDPFATDDGTSFDPLAARSDPLAHLHDALRTNGALRAGPLAELEDALVGNHTLGPPMAADEVATGGPPLPLSSFGIECAADVCSLDVGSLQIDTQPAGSAEAQPLPPPPQHGWTVDELGRSVLHLPARYARGRFATVGSVVVEHEPGARLYEGDGLAHSGQRSTAA